MKLQQAYFTTELPEYHQQKHSKYSAVDEKIVTQLLCSIK